MRESPGKGPLPRWGTGRLRAERPADSEGRFSPPWGPTGQATRSPRSDINGIVNDGPGKLGPGDPISNRSPADNPSRGRRPRWRDVLIFAGIAAFALTLRLIYVFQARSSPYFDVPILDAAYHDAWARAIVAGSPFIDTAYFRAPLYPAFLAAMYWLSGGSFLFPRIIQAAIGALTCGMVFLLGRDAFGRKVGVVAGIAAGTYWILLYFDAELLIPVVITFLDTTLVWLLLRTHRTPSAGKWLACGLILGISAIARPNILLLAPAVVAWILVEAICHVLILLVRGMCDPDCADHCAQLRRGRQFCSDRFAGRGEFLHWE
jgi:hypothetical protein